MMHFCNLCVYCNIHTVVHLTPSKECISVLDTGLNMFRGEIFAYPLYLQQDLGEKHKIEFVCTDVMCKFYPYVQRVVEKFPELQYVLQMRPFLSVMHAKGHSTRCEV